jgi:hypothetical protein
MRFDVSAGAHHDDDRGLDWRGVVAWLQRSDRGSLLVCGATGEGRQPFRPRDPSSPPPGLEPVQIATAFLE